MVSFFKDKSAVSVFWLIILCFGLHVYSLTHPPALNISANEGFSYYLLQPFVNLQPYTLSVLYVLIIFLLALQVNFIVTDLRLMQRASYTPAAAFVLLSALLPQLNHISCALLICNFLVWIIYSACRLYNAPNPKTSIYNLGLLTGLTIILYYPSLLIIVAVLLALPVMRSFRLNEWFVMIFGILTPAYFLVCYLFLKDELNILPLPQQVLNLQITSAIRLSMTDVTLMVALFITLWSIFTIKQTSERELIHARKSWNLILVAFVFLLPGIFFFQHAYPTAVLLTMLPAACCIGAAFNNTSRTILPSIIFWILIALSIYNNWFAKY